MATDPNKAVYNSTTEKAMLSARKTSNTFGVIFLIIAGLSFLALIFDAPDELWAVLGSTYRNFLPLAGESECSDGNIHLQRCFEQGGKSRERKGRIGRERN